MSSLLDELSILLALYKDYIGIQNDAKHFDINRIAESVMADMLTQLGDWGAMKVLEWDKPNHPAIDLLSADGSVGIQVTSDKSGEKVAETLNKFNLLSPTPKALYILMLRERQKDYKSADVTAAVTASKIAFSVDDHIVDLNFLRKLAEKKNDPDATEAANTHLKQAFGEWAIDVLARHRSAGKKLLSVFTEHGLHATQILDLLGAQKSLPLASAYETTFLHMHITDDILRTAADEFQVPYDWLAGTSPILGDIGQACPWRGPACAFDLIKETLTRSRDHKAIFYVVTPIEVEDFFGRCGSTIWQGERSDVPILVYSVTKGTYGDVYTHLGIQPGEIEHYRKAAWFLFAFIRKHGATAPTSYSISCQWVQWPCEKIFETASTHLLAEAQRTVDARSYQDAYDLTQPGSLDEALSGHPGWHDEFNNDYVGLVEKQLQKLEFDNVAAFRQRYISIDEQIGRRLPAESNKGIRVFGAEALRLARKCNVPIKVLHPDANNPVSMKFEDAADEFMSYVQSLHHELLNEEQKPPTVFYVDVVPEDADSAAGISSPPLQ
jgi:hypothetical protein